MATQFFEVDGVDFQLNAGQINAINQELNNDSKTARERVLAILKIAKIQFNEEIQEFDNMKSNGIIRTPTAPDISELYNYLKTHDNEANSIVNGTPILCYKDKEETLHVFKGLKRSMAAQYYNALKRDIRIRAEAAIVLQSPPTYGLASILWHVSSFTQARYQKPLNSVQILQVCYNVLMNMPSLVGADNYKEVRARTIHKAAYEDCRPIRDSLAKKLRVESEKIMSCIPKIVFIENDDINKFLQYYDKLNTTDSQFYDIFFNAYRRNRLEAMKLLRQFSEGGAATTKGFRLRCQSFKEIPKSIYFYFQLHGLIGPDDSEAIYRLKLDEAFTDARVHSSRKEGILYKMMESNDKLWTRLKENATTADARIASLRLKILQYLLNQPEEIREEYEDIVNVSEAEILRSCKCTIHNQEIIDHVARVKDDMDESRAAILLREYNRKNKACDKDELYVVYDWYEKFCPNGVRAFPKVWLEESMIERETEEKRNCELVNDLKAQLKKLQDENEKLIAKLKKRKEKKAKKSKRVSRGESDNVENDESASKRVRTTNSDETDREPQ